MGRFGVGQPIQRKDDLRLLTGQGRFTDDINLPGQRWAICTAARSIART